MPPRTLFVGGMPPYMPSFHPFHCWSVLCYPSSCTFDTFGKKRRPPCGPSTRFTVGQE